MKRFTIPSIQQKANSSLLSQVSKLLIGFLFFKVHGNLNGLTTLTFLHFDYCSINVRIRTIHELPLTLWGNSLIDFFAFKPNNAYNHDD